VVVEDVGSLEESGLTTDVIRTAVELRLRSLGIVVAGNDDPRRDYNSYLYVNVCGFHSKNGLGEYREFVTNVEVCFEQRASLMRAPSQDVFATTWSKSVVSIDHSIVDVRQTVVEFVDMFANAYLEANPISSTGKIATGR
jgi:hypothetical protein